MTQFPSSQIPGMGTVRPHRGTMILVLGILSFFCCGIILGPIAWVMGNGDLAAMNRGEMDRSGESITNAGRICGMIGTGLWVLLLIAQIILMAMGIGFGMTGTRGTP